MLCSSLNFKAQGSSTKQVNVFAFCIGELKDLGFYFQPQDYDACQAACAFLFASNDANLFFLGSVQLISFYFILPLNVFLF